MSIFCARFLPREGTLIFAISSSVYLLFAMGPGLPVCMSSLGFTSLTGITRTSFPDESFSIFPPQRSTACLTSFLETSTRPGKSYRV